MRRKSILWGMLVLVWAGSVSGGHAGTETAVVLVVKNLVDISRVAEPVTAGVPLPRQWGLADHEKLAVFTAGGIEVPSQIQVTARWGGTPTDAARPIKWALVTFLATLQPGESARYMLKVVDRRMPFAGIRIVQDDARWLIVDTGGAVFTIPKESGGLLERVIVDGVVVTEDAAKAVVIEDAAGGQYVASAARRSVDLIERGPLRVAVSVQGTLADQQGHIAMDYLATLYFHAGSSAVRILYTAGRHGEAGVRGCCSYDVFDYYGQNSITFRRLYAGLDLQQPDGPLVFTAPSAGGDLLRARARITSQNWRSDLGQTWAGPIEKNRSNSWTISRILRMRAGQEWPEDEVPKWEVILERALSAKAGEILVYQDSSGTDFWDRYGLEDHPRPSSYCRFRGYRVWLGETLLDAGDRFGGWMDLSDRYKGISLGVVDFWQNFPKGFSADHGGGLTIEIFPEQYAGEYNFRVGEEKTTEMLWYFHQGDAVQARAPEVMTGLLHPLEAWCEPAWYRETGAAGDWIPAAGSFDARLGRQDALSLRERYEYFNDRTLAPDLTVSGAYYYPFHSFWASVPGAPSAVDYFNFYGWNAYGNQPLDFEMFGDGKAGYFNTKYHLDWGAWIQFLRTGDPRWHEMAWAFSRHLEQLMLHDVVAAWDVARWQNAVFGHSQHNEPGNLNGVRNYLGPVMDTAFGARGAALHYVLTGYRPSLRFLVKEAEYARNFFTGRYEYPILAMGFERTYANLLTILVEAYLLQGDARYQELAADVLDYYAPQKQPYIHGPTRDESYWVSPWMLAMYLAALGRYAGAVEEFGLAEESARAKGQLLQFVDWLDAQVVFEEHGWLTVPYRYYADGSRDPGGLINNWMLLLADVYAYAYVFSGESKYIERGLRFFETGVHNPFYESSPLIYSTVKEAVNHAVFGHVFMRHVPAGMLDGDSPPAPAPEPEPQGPPPEPQGPPPEPQSPLPEPQNATDTTLVRVAPNGNFGASEELIVYNGLYPDYRALLRFDLQTLLPQDGSVKEASLELWCTESDGALLEVYALTRAWKEGSGTYGNTRDGATWNSTDGSRPWEQPGADVDRETDYGYGPNGVVARMKPSPGGVSIDLMPLVKRWMQGTLENHGVLLTIPDDTAYRVIRFIAREGGKAEKQPRLVLK